MPIELRNCAKRQRWSFVCGNSAPFDEILRRSVSSLSFLKVGLSLLSVLSLEITLVLQFQGLVLFLQSTESIALLVWFEHCLGGRLFCEEYRSVVGLNCSEALDSETGLSIESFCRGEHADFGFSHNSRFGSV
ncbi:hypothetical protein KC19_6G153800 [Ceratodon purpureus]|uniref:Uncharacterized protein n=1 Tax=Ceratodon purpureus TaxID=3225 RepID=A0A8T0HIC7_CERPU|nr:hypothetical protein KC19_6G153800 [Ceratodon purpureus]